MVNNKNSFHTVYDWPQPKRAYKHDAGLDLAVRETVTIEPGETVYVPANVCFNLQPGYVVQIMPRSGSFKHGVTCTPTLVDCGYTGEVRTIITNTSLKPVTIEAGTFLTQAMLVRHYFFDNETTDLIENIDGQRGDSGFGSTSQKAEKE